MDRLAEQVVAWHNRHPLAKRITIYDVHTIGVVALPFMRAGRAGGAAGPIEPVLTDEVSPDSLTGAWSGEETVAANANAAHLDALADQEDPPPRAGSDWRQKLAALLRRDKSGTQAWPAFSERFVDGLSPRRIAAFAQAQGYSSRPGNDSWPQRVVPIDDAMMARGSAAGGAWPFELYLMSAAIDAGRSRSRVLIGQGSRPAIVGRRCLSAWRVGLAVLLTLAVAGAAALALWPRPAEHAPDPASASASAPAPASAPAMPASAIEPAAAASAPEPAMAAASEPAASAPSAEPAASAPPPATTGASSAADIRPHLDLPARPPRASDAEPAAAPAETPGPKARTARPDAKPVEKPPETPPEKPAAQTTSPASAGPARAARPAAAAEAGTGNRPVVALVGPASASKAEAEAMLERLRTAVVGTQGDSKALQAQVFQTPEGWRPAVWPFASREEAQLINATLVARGMRTRAVDF